MKRICPKCGSSNVHKDAVAEWCEEANDWVLAGVHDCETCADCGAERDDLSVDAELVAKLPEIVAALRPLADETGAVDDDFRISAALEAAGFTRADLSAAWRADLVGMARALPGTFGHLRFQLPALEEA